MKKIFTIVIIIGIVILIATASSSDLGEISLQQVLYRCIMGLSMIAAGCVGQKICAYHYNKKRQDQQFYRIRNICVYENQIKESAS